MTEKLFAGLYALNTGLIIVVAAGLVYVLCYTVCCTNFIGTMHYSHTPFLEIRLALVLDLITIARFTLNSRRQ